MDYYRILNLSSEPFSNSPDPDFFFQSEQHVECLQKLEISIRLKRGLNVVIGDVGAGKTTLSRLLIRKFSEDDKTNTTLILDPDFKTSTDFLKNVSELIGVEDYNETDDDIKLKENIKSHLYKMGVDNKKTTILIVDEGQKIPLYCLEILREFLNYETNEFKLLQIVVFAQREFKDTVDGLENFRDRINFYYELGSLNYKETKGLVKYRLTQASQKSKSPSFFSFTGFIAIYLLTGGFPRKIINLCHRSLLAMIIQNRSIADCFLVLSCADAEGKKRFYKYLMAPVGSFAILGIFGLMITAGMMNMSDNKNNITVSTQLEKIEKKSVEKSLKEKNSPEAVTHINEKPSSDTNIQEKKVVNGIIEETISGETSHAYLTDSKKTNVQKTSEPNSSENMLLSSSEEEKDAAPVEIHHGIRILSGPGASIQVKRLIPDPNTP